MPTGDHSMRIAYHKFLKEKTMELKKNGSKPKDALAEARALYLKLILGPFSLGGILSKDSHDYESIMKII